MTRCLPVVADSENKKMLGCMPGPCPGRLCLRSACYAQKSNLIKTGEKRKVDYVSPLVGGILHAVVEFGRLHHAIGVRSGRRTVRRHLHRVVINIIGVVPRWHPCGRSSHRLWRYAHGVLWDLSQGLTRVLTVDTVGWSVLGHLQLQAGNRCWDKRCGSRSLHIRNIIGRKILGPMRWYIARAW